MRKSYNYEVSFSEWNNDKVQPSIVANSSKRSSPNSSLQFRYEKSIEDINCNNHGEETPISLSYSDQNPLQLIDDNNHANLTSEQSLIHATNYDSTNNSGMQFKSSVPVSNYLGSFCNDAAFPNDISDSSDINSFTDMRLANLHSKLKAETEEIRKWKEEAMDKLEKVEEMKPTSTNSIEILSEISTKESNNFESKIYQTSTDNNYNNIKSYEDKSDEFEMNKLISQLSQCCQNLDNYDKELREIKKDKLLLQKQLDNKTQYCYELENKIENLDTTMKKVMEYDANNDAAQFYETDIIKKDNSIKHLKENLQFEKQEREKEMKENDRLKEQQVELKNQMTKLMTYANATKRESGAKEKIISEFYEEQYKLGEITNCLKCIVNDNKSIFENMSDELCVKTQRLNEILEHTKTLEEQIKQLELKNQQLQKEIEQTNTKNDKLIDLNKKLIQDSTQNFDKEFQEKAVLQQEIEQLKIECVGHCERNNSLQHEISIAEETQTQLKLRSDQICRKFEELQHKTKMTQEQSMGLTKRLEDRERELSEFQEIIAELRVQYNSSEAARIVLQQEIGEMKNSCTESKHVSDLEKKALVQKYSSEIEASQNKISSLQQEIKKLNKTSEKIQNEHSKEIMKLENQINDLRQQKSEMVEYLYKLPTSSIKWGHFFQ